MMQEFGPEPTIVGNACHRAPDRVKAYSTSPSISYSFIPGFSDLIASFSASHVISTARRIASISEADFTRRNRVRAGPAFKIRIWGYRVLMSETRADSVVGGSSSPAG